MIQPLQYQSMFVPTDIGVMNDQIMKRDAEYSQNEAMLAAAQDKYANVASHPSAVGYKNSLLDELQSNTDKMISDYGGDIGAIDKQTLVKNMNSIRPQIQDLQKHAMLAEEQRKTASKYGVFADVQNDISDYEGWVANGRKEAKVGNIGDYQKYVELGYGDIGSMIRQGGVSKDGDIKGLLKQYQTMGIRADEKEKYKDIIKEDLMKTSGTSDAIADNIAEQQVLKLTRGYKQISHNDPGYVKPSKPSDSPLSNATPVTMSYDKTTIDNKVKGANKEYSELEESAKAYNEYSKNYDESKKLYQVEETTGDEFKVLKTRYEQALSKYENDATYKDMVQNGADPMVAAKYVAGERSKMYAQNSGYYKPTVREVDTKVKNDLMSKTTDFVGAKSIASGKAEDVDSKDFSEMLANSTIKSSEFNLMDGTIRLTVVKDKKLEHYTIPVENLQNQGAKESLKSYKSFLDDVYGKSVSGDRVTSSDLVMPGGNSMYRFTSTYNKDTQSYDKTIKYFAKEEVADENGNKTLELIPYDFNGDFNAGLTFFGKHAATSVTDGYGKQVQYKRRNR